MATMTDKSAKATKRQKAAIAKHNAENAKDPLAPMLVSPIHWLLTMFGDYFPTAFSTYHCEFWAHMWCRVAGLDVSDPDVRQSFLSQGLPVDSAYENRPPAFFGIWPRGGAKSTSAELAVCMMGALGAKKYCLYVSETQEQSDDHVSNIASLLERPQFWGCYPAMGQRLLTKYGHSRGWRRNRLRTATGFTVDSIGLDTAARGVKLEDMRPDMMVFDDIDSEHDNEEAVQKKIKSLTTKLIPAGNPKELAIIAAQNLVHPKSIFSKVVDKQVDFLTDRIVSGPTPALLDFEYEWDGNRYVITAGIPTWEGMDIEQCQDMIDDMGLTAFLSECQHVHQPIGGGMFDHLDFESMRMEWHETFWNDVVRCVCWVDPAVTRTDRSDAQAISIAAMMTDGKIVKLYNWEQRSTPLNALVLALQKAREWKCEKVGIETDQGGDTWISVYHEAQKATGIDNIPMDWAKAGSQPGSKVHRASQMLADYERGNISHLVGTHTVLENALTRFPRTKPYDLVDANFWSWFDLVTMSQQDQLVEYEDRVEISPV